MTRKFRWIASLVCVAQGSWNIEEEADSGNWSRSGSDKTKRLRKQNYVYDASAKLDLDLPRREEVHQCFASLLHMI